MRRLARRRSVWDLLFINRTVSCEVCLNNEQVKNRARQGNCVVMPEYDNDWNVENYQTILRLKPRNDNSNTRARTSRNKATTTPEYITSNTTIYHLQRRITIFPDCEPPTHNKLSSIPVRFLPFPFNSAPPYIPTPSTPTTNPPPPNLQMRGCTVGRWHSLRHLDFGVGAKQLSPSA